MAKKLPSLVIFGDPKKGHVNEAVASFTDFVKDKAEILASYCVDECTVDIFDKCNYAIVFGGDGTIISAARNLKQSSVPVIGVNVGKLGFLAEFSLAELKQYFDIIIAGKAHIEKRMMLNCRVFRDEKEQLSVAAINDVFFTSGPPFRMIELKICVDGQSLAGCVSDGLVIATPTGSTAYNLSAGGPIVSGNMDAVVITPICPHSLSFRPIVINASSRIEVVGLRLNEGTTVSIDGQVSWKLQQGDIVRVQKEKSDFLLVNNPLRTQWDTLATKLGWAEKFRYNKGNL